MRLLGEIITEIYNLNQEVINQALALQRSNGLRLGEILIAQNIISEPDLDHALIIQSAWSDSGNEEPAENLMRIMTWSRLLLLSVVLGGAVMAGIWYVSGLLLSMFSG